MNKLLFITTLDRKEFKEVISKIKTTKFIFKNPKRKKDVIYIKRKYKDFNFLISYASGLIIPKNIITHFNKFNLMNFHPSTPKFRGRDSQHFAAYFKEKTFGGTMHYLTNKVDNGTIIDVKDFKMKKNSDHYDYHRIALKSLKILLKKNIRNFLFNKKKLKKNNFKWSKKVYKRSDFLNKLKIPKGIKKKDFDHIYKSFYTNDRLSLYAEINKKKFFIIEK